MSLSIFVKSILACLLYRSKWVKRQLKQLGEVGFLIITYHRIIPYSGITRKIQSGMYLTPETFERHLKWLVQQFDVVPLGKLTKGKSNVTRANSRFVCSLTFDDGWRDLYDFAFPILKKYKVPATAFLPTGFVGTCKQFWTDRFAYLLYHRRVSTKGTVVHHSIRNVIHRIQELRGSFERQLEAGVALLKRYPLYLIEEILDNLAKAWGVDFPRKERVFVNWGEAREMLNSGLINFGSHTQNHQILTTLREDEIQYELISSKEDLLRNNVVNSSFIPFCYPNGNYTKRIAEMVQRAGYHLAVTTKKGWNDFSTSPFELNRVPVHQDISSTEPMFMCRLLGVF